MSVFEYAPQQHHSSQSGAGLIVGPLTGRHRAPDATPLSRLRSASTIALVAAVPAAVPAAVVTGSVLVALMVAIGTIAAVALAGLMI